MKREWKWDRIHPKARELYGPKFRGALEPGAWPIPGWAHAVVIIAVFALIVWVSS